MLRERRLKSRLSATVLALVFFLPVLLAPRTAAAQQCSNTVDVVHPGESLWGISQRYGVSMDAIASANGLANPTMIVSGQRLTIPTCGGAPAAPSAPAASGQTVHVVQPGDSFWSISQRYGVSMEAIARANGMSVSSVIIPGQRLIIPAGGSAAAAPAPSAPTPPAGVGKRIEVNLSTQSMYAWEGNVLVLSSGISSGRPGWDTPAGNFRVYAKYPVQTMQGTVSAESWYVPNVPSVMYIFGGIALHGTYWHNSFGTGDRLSHGCINLPLGAAAQLYNWAPMGTPVWVHY